MEQCFPTKDSLYDFIYLDNARINTLLSQLSNEGITSQLKKLTVESESKSGHSTVGLESFFSLGKDNLKSIEEKLESSIDTSWILPMMLLNEISDYIKRSPDSTSLGELVLLSGDMLLLDIPTLKKNIPLLKHLIKQNNNGKIDKETETGIKLMELFPESIQLRVKENNNKYWMTLEPDFFTINPEDLSLKYGSILVGKWYILGYVDSIPVKEQLSQESGFYFEKETESTLMHQSIIDVFVSNMDSLKKVCGCNEEEFAISPIMIFKSVC